MLQIVLNSGFFHLLYYEFASLALLAASAGIVSLLFRNLSCYGGGIIQNPENKAVHFLI